MLFHNKLQNHSLCLFFFFYLSEASSDSNLGTVSSRLGNARLQSIA